jgi:hypothetical protein
MFSKWRDFPHLQIVADHGSDGFCGGHGLQYNPLIKLNVSFHWDPAHGSWRDCQGAIRHVGLSQWQLLGLITMNLPHGPDGSDMRYTQVKEAMAHCFRLHDHLSCGLFQGHVREILHDLGGDFHCADGLTKEEAAWHWLAEHSAFQRKGYKTNNNRFHSFICDGEAMLKDWHSRLFQCEYVGLELDMLVGSKLKDRLVRKAALRTPDAPKESTSALAIDDRTLRSCCNNAVVISLMFLGDGLNRSLLEMVVRVCRPVTTWHTGMERQTRSVSGGSAWLRSQLDGALMEHVFNLLLVLTEYDLMDSLGLLHFQKVAGAEITDVQLWEDEEKTHMCGNMVLCLMASRLRRSMWMIGNYPVALLRMASEQRCVAEPALAEFKLDWEVYQKTSKIERPPAALKHMLSRSSFNLLATLQIVAGLEANGWAMNEEVHRMLLERSKVAISTQVVEDINNVMKNDKDRRGLTKFRRPQSGMAAAIVSDVLGTIHQYDAIKGDACLPRKAVVLGKSVFQNLEESSLPFSNLVSTSSKSPHFSPSPQNVGYPAADAALLRTGDMMNRTAGLAESAWMGFFSDASHNVCFRIKNPAMATDWYLGLGHYDGSSCLVWPVSKERFPEHPDIEWLRPKKLTAPCFVQISDFEAVEGFLVKWRSWAWQRKHLPAKTAKGKIGIRLFRDSDIEPILRVCARQAWWAVPRHTLEDIATNQKVHAGSGCSLFSLVFALTKKVLGLDDASTCTILQSRMARMKDTGNWSDAIMEIDEAVQVLDENDREEVTKAQKRITDDHEHHAAFASEYKEKVKASKGGDAPPKKRAKKPETFGYTGPPRLPAASELSQADGKKYMPPGASLWKAAGSGTWNSKLPPYSQTSRSWAKYGEAEAMRLCIVAAWENFMESRGEDTLHCPVLGIFGLPV